MTEKMRRQAWRWLPIDSYERCSSWIYNQPAYHFFKWAVSITDNTLRYERRDPGSIPGRPTTFWLELEYAHEIM